MEITESYDRKPLKYGLMTVGIALLAVGTLVGCGADSDEGTASAAALPADGGNYIVLEGTTVGAAQATWFGDSYLASLSSNPNVTGTQSFVSLGSPFPGAVEAPEGASYLSLFNFVNATAAQGFLTSNESAQAANAAATSFPNGEVAMMWRVAYRESFVTNGAGADGPRNYVTFVALNPAVDIEGQVMQWEDQTHIPWVMQYPGIAKVVRYEKIPGAEVNGTAFPKFIELFYYPDQASFDGLSDSQPFQDAEADRMATWTDDQLGIPFVLWGQLSIAQ